MQYNIHQTGELRIAEITPGSVRIESAGDFLDLIANVPSRVFILQKEMFDESFFDLSSGLAGEILQKCSNYHVKMAVIGDFTAYSSKALNDFMFESNKTGQILFVDSVESAVKRFAQ